jgi:hypothetical protein
MADTTFSNGNGNGTNGGRSRPPLFNPQITAGTLITVLTVIVTVALGVGRIETSIAVQQARHDALKDRVDRMEPIVFPPRLRGALDLGQ